MTVTEEPPAVAEPAKRSGISEATKDRLNRVLLNIIAAVVAGLFAGAITSVILLVRGDSPSFVISQMWDYGTTASTELTIVNGATVYYLSAVAVAIGFRMNLFNIGVDGQYRLAAMLAGAFAGSVAPPNGVRQGAAGIVALLGGGRWGGVRGPPQTARRGS